MRTLLTVFLLTGLAVAERAKSIPDTHATAQRRAPAEARCTLSAEDLAEIATAMPTYQSSWLAGDREGVLGLFTKDAVLMPHHGDPPVVGREAIEKFWWPPGAPPFKLLRMEIKIDEVGGGCGLAYQRGSHEMSWTVGDKVQSQRGTYLNLFRRQGGVWKISHRMWDDP